MQRLRNRELLIRWSGFLSCIRLVQCICIVVYQALEKASSSFYTKGSDRLSPGHNCYQESFLCSSEWECPECPVAHNLNMNGGEIINAEGMRTFFGYFIFPLTLYSIPYIITLKRMCFAIRNMARVVLHMLPMGISCHFFKGRKKERAITILKWCTPSLSLFKF